MKFYGRKKTISPLEYFRDLRTRRKNICKCCKTINGTGKGEDEPDEVRKPMMQEKGNTSDRHTTDRNTARVDRQASVAVQSTSSGHSVYYGAPLATTED